MTEETPAPVELPDGIYFTIPEDDYHAIRRLSGSAICKLRISPGDWWAESWLNPNPRVLTPAQQQAKDAAKVLGRAYHCARLTPALLSSTFLRGFEPSPDALTSGAAIERELAARELPKKFKDDKGVLDQARRLREAGYDKPILHLEEEAWQATQKGRWPVPPQVWDEMLVDMDRLRAVPEADALLTGGAAEVSLLYTCPQTGLPMKTRLDYLKADSWSDFKSFANPNGKHIEQCVNDAFRFNRYHIKAWVQREAVQLIVDGTLKVQDGSAEDAAIIDALRGTEPECWYIWQQKGGVPNVLCKRLEFFTVPVNTTAQHAGADEQQRAAMDRSTRTITAWANRAKEEMLAAKADFQTYSEVYQPGEPWQRFNPVGTTSDADFHPSWLDGRI